MAKQRLTPRFKKIRPNQVHLDERFTPSSPDDAIMLELFFQATRHEIPVDHCTVAPTAIQLHNPQALKRVQATLLEEPWLVRSMAAMAEAYPPEFPAHRHDGQLCVHSEYLAYAVALATHTPEITLLVLGEGPYHLTVTSGLARIFTHIPQCPGPEALGGLVPPRSQSSPPTQSQERSCGG